ncbi:MAG: hypothetical protein WKG32_06445 [Gemmatimonadaceae bacterium]
MADPGVTLERLGSEAEPPRIVDARVVEDATMRARLVPGAPAAEFAAFLDGAQQSRVVGVDLSAPIVFATVAAAVRVRVERRLVTWRQPVVQRRVYVPLDYTDRAAFEAAFGPGQLVDTTEPDDSGEIPSPHPAALLERARQAVSRDRDLLEQRLAEQWCREEHRPLFIDGGIGASEAVAKSGCAIGVIKSHRTLWAGGDALRIVLGLRAGERSSVIAVAHRERARVLSWYLRLRAAEGHDTLWGLIRVEVAECADPTERADRVSRWVLAEATPLASPDSRWDKMAYGIRNTEEFLRAIV